jgi:hypothetical protein
VGNRRYNGSAWSYIENVLTQYGDKMTAKEIGELLPDMPSGTIASQLSQKTAEGRLRSDKVDGMRDRRYWLNNGYEVIEAVVVEPEPQQAAIDPWETLRVQWQVVFGVKVSAADARLMTELAAREMRK